MKKILIGILLIFPLVWAGMTWVASNKTEEIFNSRLAQASQKIREAAPIFRMEKQSFSKGFISSTAKSIIRIDPEIFGNENSPKIILDHTIYHGPLMLTEDGIKVGTSYIITTLDQAPLEEKIRQAIALIFSGKQPFISRTQTHFSTSITEFIEIPRLDIDSAALAGIFKSKPARNDAHFKLSLAGVLAEFTTNPELNFLEGQVLTEALNIVGSNTSNNFSLKLNSSSMEIDIDELYYGAMLLGSVTFKLPEVLINSDNQNVLLSDLKLKSVGNEQAEFYNQELILDIDTLAIKAGNAAIFPESKVHMSFTLKGLDQIATKHMIDVGRLINQTQRSSSNSHEELAQQRDIDIKNYLQALSDLIKPGLASNNVIELSNDKGGSNIHFDLNYVSAKKLVELKTLKELIMALSAELSMHINKNQFDGTAIEMLLNSPMAMSGLKKNATAYTTLVTLNNGELNLNGETIPLLEQLGSTVEKPLDWDEYFR